MRIYEQLRIAPFSELLDSTRGRSDHCGGPAYPDWQSEVSSRHCRYDTKPIDIEPPPPQVVPARIHGEYAYLGPICHHFGHQVADFSMRILPTKLSGFDGMFLFAVRQGSSPLVKRTPRFFREIIGYFGIPHRRIAILNSESVFDHVCVFPQAETVHGSPPSDAHLAALEAHFERRLPRPRWYQRKPPRFIYVSRGKIVRGVHAGEEVIEGFMRNCGAHVLYPEHEPLDNLMRIYDHAEFLVFSEGSALHALQFLGHQLKNVVVINRHQGSKFGANFLAKRCKSLTYIDAVIGGISGNQKGRFRETGISVLCPERLLEGMRSSLPIDVRRWSHDEFRKGFSRTFNNWIAGFLLKALEVDEDVESKITSEAAALGIIPDEYGMSLLRSKIRNQNWPRDSGIEDANRAYSLQKSDVAAANAIDLGTKETNLEAVRHVMSDIRSGELYAEPSLRVKCIQALSDLGEKQQADEMARELLVADGWDPVSASDLGMLSSAMLQAGNLDLARRTINLAVERGARRFWLWLHKAHVDRASGDLKSAESSAAKAYALDPQRSEGCYLMAILASEMNNIPLALARIEEALNIEPKPAYVKLRDRLRVRQAN